MAVPELADDDHRNGIGRETAGCQQEALLYVPLVLLTASVS